MIYGPRFGYRDCVVSGFMIMAGTVTGVDLLWQGDVFGWMFLAWAGFTLLALIVMWVLDCWVLRCERRVEEAEHTLTALHELEDRVTATITDYRNRQRTR